MPLGISSFSHFIIPPLFMQYCRYLPGPDDMLVLDIAYMIYMKFEEFTNALQIALFLDNVQVCTLIELTQEFYSFVIFYAHEISSLIVQIW